MEINININIDNQQKRVRFDFLLIGILLCAAFLRLYKLGFQGAWLDELHTLKEADPNLTFSQFHEVIMWREGIPHFYFIIVRLFSSVFGHEIVIVRLVSALCGILLVYSMFLLGKELISKRVGYIAASFVAVHPFLIEYSQDGRSYSMLALFVVLAFYRLAKFIKKPNLLNAAYLGLFSGLITNAHPIGVVNVVSIFIIIGVVLLTLKERKQRVNLIKYSFLAGIVTLAVFSPVYMIIAKLAGMKSFWVQQPSFDYVIQVLSDVSGHSKLIFILVIGLFLCFTYLFVKAIAKNKTTLLAENAIVLSYLITSVWMIFFIIFMIVKSLDGASVVLHRYFISLSPVFFLIPAIVIGLIENKFLRNTLILSFIGINVANLLVVNNYYSKLTKAQFEQVYNEINASSEKNDKIISNWGWLLSYYFQKDNPNKIVLEKDLENYTQDMLKGNTNGLSFWYIDGNSRPYMLGGESEKFLKENFIVTKEIKMHDAWAIHYKSKNPNNLFIELPNFKPALFDGTGAMIFVENSKSTYPALDVEEGNYVFSFKGLSLPEKPIKGENAHFNVLINDNKIGEFNLSNLPNQKPIDLNYKHKGGKLVLKLDYDNDIVVGNEDRNAILNAITIKKNK